MLTQLFMPKQSSFMPANFQNISLVEETEVFDLARVMSVLDFFSKWKCSALAVFDCVYLFSASFVLLQPSILIFPSTRGGLAQEQGKSKIGAASFTLCTLACIPLLLL